jgi:hypothetical protein
VGVSNGRKMSEALTDLKYGPQTVEIEALIKRAKSMTPVQVRALSDAYGHAYNDKKWLTVWNGALNAVMQRGLNAAQEEVCRLVDTEVLPEIQHATCDAILALLVRSLISTDQFDLLYGPWALVMEAK